MNPNTISPDDPRLTLYALSEMEPAEREGFEKLLQQDAAARQAVEEIRAMAVTVTTALEQEATLAEFSTGESARQAAIIPGGNLRRLDGGPLKEAAKLIRFPQIYFMISGLAAACFAVFFTYWQQTRSIHAPHSYMEVGLDKLASADAQKKESLPAGAVKGDSRPAAAAPAPVPAVTMALANEPQPAPAESEIVALSPFSVDAKAKQDYTGAVLLSNSLQMRSELKDSSNAVPVETGRFQRDIGASGANSSIAPAKGGGASFSSRSNAFTVATTAGRTKQVTLNPESIAIPGERRDFNTEAYRFLKDNDYLRVADQPLSTFSVDVDTASYANVRRFLTQGQRPPADAVRIEELVNYFPYRYAPPTGNVPFAAHLEVASAPWAPEHRLVRIGLKVREVSDAQRPAANLVFLLDVSGSMDEPNKLPLVKQSLRLLVNKLRSDDHVAIAVYAGASGLALPSTPANRKAEILDAIDRLQAEGSTNGAMGIQLAYDIAKANFVPGGVNRVILATDGDWNVGTTSEGELMRLIGEKAKSGVFLTVLGFGMGNLKDSMLEQLADKGNGNYAYIDTLAEAKKTLVEQAGGTLVTIAKDVKIQVEFNPAQVQAYRLIGYENRLLAKEDFNNDKVDAGEIGAGHTVTALYEVVPAGAESPIQAPGVDALKYQKVETPNAKGQMPNNGEMLTVKIRYKEPTGDVSSKLEFPLRDTGARFEDASTDFKFAAAVAGFGMALRESPLKGSLTLAAVADWGRAGLGDDAGGYRNEFLSLVKQAEALQQ